MSDYCKGCDYDKKLRVGPRACPYNSLYWDFFQRNKAQLEGNHRLSMVYRQLEKMDDTVLIPLQEQAATWRSSLDTLLVKTAERLRRVSSNRRFLLTAFWAATSV